VIVAQAGEGSDELLWGYPSWKTHLRLERANALPVPRAAKRLGLAALRAAGRETSRPYEFLRRGAEGLPVFWGGAEAFTETQKRRLLSPRLRREHATTSSWDALAPIRRRFDEKAWERTPLNWMTYLDLNLRLPELLLLRIDKMSMAASIEARVPFLDHKVVELAFSIPTEAKTRNGELKGLLKRAVRGVLPDDVIDRPKQGFRVPVDEWFLDRLGERTREELDAFCRDTDLLDRAEVQRVLERPKRDAWYLLNLALWWRASFAR
jgi:asparagine synthase (glutamine-hydrolysing)